MPDWGWTRGQIGGHPGWARWMDRKEQADQGQEHAGNPRGFWHSRCQTLPEKVSAPTPSVQGPQGQLLTQAVGAVGTPYTDAGCSWPSCSLLGCRAGRPRVRGVPQTLPTLYLWPEPTHLMSSMRGHPSRAWPRLSIPSVPRELDGRLRGEGRQESGTCRMQVCMCVVAGGRGGVG